MKINLSASLLRSLSTLQGIVSIVFISSLHYLDNNGTYATAQQLLWLATIVQTIITVSIIIFLIIKKYKKL